MELAGGRWLAVAVVNDGAGKELVTAGTANQGYGVVMVVIIVLQLIVVVAVVEQVPLVLDKWSLSKWYGWCWW
jgi:hypothetical protein